MKWIDKITVQGDGGFIAGEPGVSGFFTTPESVMLAGNDAAALFRGLEVGSRQGVYRDKANFFL